VFLEKLAASSMHLDRHRAGELITGQVRALAALMRVTDATACSYLGDEIVKDMARQMLFEVAGERPGADLLEAPRTAPLPLALVGITVAALAEAMQVRAARYITRAADLAANGGKLPEGIPETARSQLAATLRRDADGLIAIAMTPPTDPYGRRHCFEILIGVTRAAG
jgi:hypothetical protein